MCTKKHTGFKNTILASKPYAKAHREKPTCMDLKECTYGFVGSVCTTINDIVITRGDLLGSACVCMGVINDPRISKESACVS